MPTNRKLTAPFITVPLESAGVPIFRRIYETLRRQILSGQLSAKPPLPSTRALARQTRRLPYDRRNAYEQLLAEGCIEGLR